MGAWMLADAPVGKKGDLIFTFGFKWLNSSGKNENSGTNSLTPFQSKVM